MHTRHELNLAGAIPQWHVGLLWMLALLAGCSGKDEPAIEIRANDTWRATAVSSYDIDGKRDGRTTTATATFGLQDGTSLQVRFVVTYDPQPVLSGGHWRHEDRPVAGGTVTDLSMKFFGGQGEGPSLGGRFRLDQDGQPRFRVTIPLRPVSQPTWQ